MTTEFPSKLVAERVTLTFEFAAEIAQGETISSATVTISSLSEASPALAQNGALSHSGTTVLVPILGGTAGTSYQIDCVIVTSNALKILGIRSVMVTE